MDIMTGKIVIPVLLGIEVVMPAGSICLGRVSNRKGSRIWVYKWVEGATELQLRGNGATISHKFLFKRMEEASC
jgi:hypothetical protein